MAEADDDVAAIAQVIAGGDQRAGYAQLAARIGWPRGKDLPELAPWLALLANLAERRGAEQLARLARHVVRDPDSPDRLYELGYALIDAHASGIAASVLWRCMQLVGDSEQVVCELVSALETHLAHGDAFALLEAREALRAESFMCQYLYAFNAAMSGRLDVTRAVLPSLGRDGANDDQSGARFAGHDQSGARFAGHDRAIMIGAIRGIVERADRVAGAFPLDAADLRGWHYVLTGGLLVHQS